MEPGHWNLIIAYSSLIIHAPRNSMINSNFSSVTRNTNSKLFVTLRLFNLFKEVARYADKIFRVFVL